MIIKAPIRGIDTYGSGAFGAPRGGRTHNGIDIACYKGSQVLSQCDGVVTKIGYPYDPGDDRKGHLRYVQVTDAAGRNFRYFYVNSTVKINDVVLQNDVIGITQGLVDIYPGITDHVHVEIKYNNNYLNPEDFLNV